MKHVLIAGAGIVGVSSAIWLQRAGCRVTIVDRAGPASGTSHGNAGVLAAGAVVPVTVPGLTTNQLETLLLECTNLPPYKGALRRAFDVEIIDILTQIERVRPRTIQPGFL